MKEMAAFDFHGEAPVVLPILSTVSPGTVA
jgi:hypothetical protein